MIFTTHCGGNDNNHQTDKENPNYNKGDFNNEKIEELKVKLRKETFLTSDDDMDVEKLKNIMNEIEDLNPPKKFDVDTSLKTFRANMNKVEFDKKDEKQGKSKPINRIKLMIPLIAIIIVMAVGIGTYAFKFNLFEVVYDFGNNIKRVVFNQDNENKNTKEIPKDLSSAKNEKHEFYNYQDVFEAIGFSFPVPEYLPANVQISSIKTEKTGGNNYDFDILYILESEKFLTISINFSETMTSYSVNYENDYSKNETINVLGQTVSIITDEYNKKCDFTYGAFVYYVSTSNENISLSEFKKVVESIN